ncbi:hypothetical protein NP233_g441 [Leucocoprinus birnbaumii]|uniref:Uncharacterized protein n=1 Tax=Leucocoprinus birnbaumii TaxID=56174 RepID=A0AAD5W5I3_9AGAR|nr:hypothetical protein NP233_g441 [Leucocoprinus birnbaumii]
MSDSPRIKELRLAASFEFTGWGSKSRLSLSEEDTAAGQKDVEAIKAGKVLGQFTASAIAGNAVLGSVFYALPAVVAVGGIYSPICLFSAALVMFVWRPIMEELASALPISGGPFTYFLNVTSKPLTLASATLLLLDYGSTSVVSAATASAYLAGEVHLPFPYWVGAVIVILLFICISLSGIRDSARFALGVFSFHATTMVILIIISAVHWGKTGNDQLRENWRTGLQTSGIKPAEIIKQIYFGFALGMLELTGFECTPSYVASIKDKQFPRVLRNLHLPAILLNCIVMLLLLATIPLETILGGANVLSVLSEQVSGKWLRIWIVIDAIVVLCGGVLTGIVAACELFGQLAQIRAIPALYLRVLPATGAPYASILSFGGFCGLLYASAAGRLDVLSLMFSLVWMNVMNTFPLALLLLKHNRNRLRRDKDTSLMVIFAAFALIFVAIIGNLVVYPTTLEYFAAYFIGILMLFFIAKDKSQIIRRLHWIFSQIPFLARLNKLRGLTETVRNMRKQPVCILVKNQEIDQLCRMVLYVQRNEETSCIKVVHFIDDEKGIPADFESNARVLDEAFPELTMDLVLIPASFEPASVAALASKLQIPTALMFMGCPNPRFPYSITELGTRIIPT